MGLLVLAICWTLLYNTVMENVENVADGKVGKQKSVNRNHLVGKESRMDDQARLAAAKRKLGQYDVQVHSVTEVPNIKKQNSKNVLLIKCQANKYFEVPSWLKGELFEELGLPVLLSFVKENQTQSENIR